MRTYITALMLATALALVACGGGNDVASSGTSAVSAAASTASTPSTPAPEPKVNGQVDERTGVAPVVAALTAWSPTSNGGCLRSRNIEPLNIEPLDPLIGLIGPNVLDGPAITWAQRDACIDATQNATDTENQKECTALGGAWQPTTWYCTANGYAANSQQCRASDGAWEISRAFCKLLSDSASFNPYSKYTKYKKDK